jgi:hypothetical protein
MVSCGTQTYLLFTATDDDTRAIAISHFARMASFRLTLSTDSQTNVRKRSIMDIAQATVIGGNLVAIIKRDFYNGGAFTAIGGLPVTGAVRLDNGIGNAVPNSTLGTHEHNSVTDVVIDVNSRLLQLGDNAVKFALAHELGHAFSEKLAADLGYDHKRPLDGPRTEIIADLGAAYLLKQAGVSWDDICNVANNGVATGIFNAGWSGDHPPGAKRAECVKSLAELMKAGHSFKDALKGLLLSLEGYGQGH